jgi:acetolactate synthase-1/3 small subunit
VFRAQVVDTTTSSFIFELTGAPEKIDTFVALMKELGLVEVGRTGIVGMIRGAQAA